MALPIELGFIILFSILGGVLAVRFKQPSVLGLILVGALIGPNTLGLIKDESLINISIEVGAILLLFSIGTKFSLSHLIKLGSRLVLTSAIKLGLAFLTAYYTSLLLGFGTLTSLYMGVILSITSTVVMVKILEQKGFYARKEVNALIAILILEDLFGVFALTFFSSLNSDLRPISLLTGIMVSLTILIFVYLILQKILKKVISWLIKYSTEDTITFISFGLCGGMSYLAALLNLSPSVGAFLAGNIVSSFPNSKLFENAIQPFTLTFTSLFFFSIGTAVNFNTIFSQFHIILILFLVWAITVFFAVGFGSYLFMNHTGQEAVFCGLAMIPIGEFSLLIAREASYSGADLISITSAIILFSATAMSLLIGHYGFFYNSTKKLVPSGLLQNIRLSLSFFNNLSWRMIKDKISMRKIAAEWRIVWRNLTVILMVLIITYWSLYIFGDLLNLLQTRYYSYIVLAVIVLIIVFPLKSIIQNARKLFKDTVAICMQLYPDEISKEKRLLRNFMYLGISFILLIIFPGIFIFFKVHPFFHLVILLILALVIFELFRSSRLICVLIGKKDIKKFRTDALRNKK